MSDERLGKMDECWLIISDYLRSHAYIMNSDVRKLCGISAATANCVLASLASKDKLMKCRVGKSWVHKLTEH